MTYSELVGDVKFFLTGSSVGTTDFTAADICLSLNRAYDKTTSLLMRADSRWEFDDSNYETLPVATTNLVSGQADYAIDAASFLNVIRLEMKDPSGNAIHLVPISYEDKIGTAMTEWQKTNGTPHSYDKVGNSFILYPASNYSSEAGLKIYFQRPPSYFIVTDTTKTPGFNPQFHRLLSLGAARDYCIVNSLNNRLVGIEREITRLEGDFIAWISSRSKDEHPRISFRKESYSPDDYGKVSENSVG